jgi:ABC-type branched-subunit amino acid transport system substrate-binding protein
MRRQLIAVVLAVGLAGAALAGGLAACTGDDEPAEVTGRGVTREPCPRAVDRTKGCIYLGFISDLRNPNAAALTHAQQRFWDRVNRAGGIGGHEVDAETYVRDNRNDPRTHTRLYEEIRGKVLALGQTMGAQTTASVISQMRADDMVAAPASSTSAWGFEPTIVESGANHCVEGVNAVDFAVASGPIRSVMSIHLPGDYGDDHAAGARAAAAANNATFINIKTDPGADRQSGAVDAILARRPDVVVLAVHPAETAVIVAGAAAGGFAGRIIGAGPSWDPELLRGPQAPALRALYLQSSPWAPWSADTPGHRAMRAALGSAPPHEGQVGGWIWSYPLKAALDAAAKSGDLTRAGLVRAVRGLRSVDYEGMLPAGAGDFAGGAGGPGTGGRGASGRGAGGDQSLILSPATGTGVADVPVVRDFFAGRTLAGFNPDRPCFQDL